MSAEVNENAIHDYYRDPVTEKWLETWPIHASELRMVALNEIDMKASRDYQNRIASHVDDDHVNVIANALRDPSATVPPIVVRRRSDGRLVIGDGNHRAFGAQKAGRTTLMAYVVTCDDKTFHSMAIAANARNAKSLTTRERNVLMSKMVQQGLTQRTVAQQWGVHPSVVSDVHRVMQGEDLLREAGLAQPENLVSKALTAAARLTVEDLSAIGTQALKEVSGAQMEAAVAEILGAKPSERLKVADEVGKKIIQEHAAKDTPKAKQNARGAMGYTPKRTVNALIKITEVLAEKPGLRENDEVRLAFEGLVKTWES